MRACVLFSCVFNPTFRLLYQIISIAFMCTAFTMLHCLWTIQNIYHFIKYFCIKFRWCWCIFHPKIIICIFFFFFSLFCVAWRQSALLVIHCNVISKYKKVKYDKIWVEYRNKCEASSCLCEHSASNVPG